MPIARKHGQISRRIWVLTLIMLVAMWVFVIVFFRIYKAEVVEGKRQELIQMNNVVAQHTRALLKSVQIDLNVMGMWIEAAPRKDLSNDPVFMELIGRLTRNADGLIDLRVVHTDGVGYAVPRLPSIPYANVRDMAYVQEAVAGYVGRIHLGAPIIARLTGRRVIPVALKLPPNASNVQLVVAAIDLQHLWAVQDDWLPQGRGSISVMREDGTMLSRIPVVEDLLGHKFLSAAAFQRWKDKPNGVYLTEHAASDGLKRLISYEHLDEFNVYVTVSRGYDESLATFYKVRAYSLMGMVFLTLFFIGAAMSIYRSQRELHLIQQNYQRLALVDELTLVMNRRAFMRNAEKELATMRLRGENLAVLMIDLDHFKQINDQFGHAAGDEVLKSVAALWLSALRRQDILGRLGGEEFAVALPLADRALACEVAERIRRTTAQQITVGPESASVTISVGIAILNDGKDSIKDLLNRADEALYQAKQRGRNRVEVYEAPDARSESA